MGASSIAILRIRYILGTQVFFDDEGLKRLLSLNPPLMTRGLRTGAPKINEVDLGVIV